MGNEINTLHPEIQLEQDIVVLAHDIYENTGISNLSNLKDHDKDYIQIRFNGIFSVLSASWEYLSDEAINILSDNDFLKEIRKNVSKEGFLIIKQFLDDLSLLYQKIETDIQPNETRYAYALAAALMNVWILSTDLNMEHIAWWSTSFNLEYAKQVQDKISDIISFTSQ